MREAFQAGLDGLGRHLGALAETADLAMRRASRARRVPAAPGTPRRAAMWFVHRLPPPPAAAG